MSSKNGLTTKQKVFVEQYLQCWNATEAARRAGYSERSIRTIASENLAKPNIKLEIDTRIAELKMSADEVLLRLADQARGDMGDFLLDGDVTLDHEKIHSKGYLIRSLTSTKNGHRIELHNSQSALQLIGKQLGMFDDKLTIKVEQELDKVLEHLQTVLDSDVYQKVIEALASD